MSCTRGLELTHLRGRRLIRIFIRDANPAHDLTRLEKYQPGTTTIGNNAVAHAPSGNAVDVSGLPDAQVWSGGCITAQRVRHADSIATSAFGVIKGGVGRCQQIIATFRFRA